jgi:hypothetical protein
MAYVAALMEDFSQRMASLERNVLAGSAAPERSASSSGEGEPMEEEEPDGLASLSPLGDQPGDMVVTELSEMKAVRALIRHSKFPIFGCAVAPLICYMSLHLPVSSPNHYA